MTSNFLELTYNLAILVALSVVSGFIRQRWEQKWQGALLQGLLFGGAAVIGMMRPLALGPVLIFDGRSVMLSLCGLFFGPLAAGVASGMALCYRLIVMGVSFRMGGLVIVSSALLGLAFHYLWTRRRVPLSAWRLLGFGLLVHVVMLLMLLTLPAGQGFVVVQRLGLPILLAYPLVTLLIGKVLSGQEATLRSLEALRLTRFSIESASDAMFWITPDAHFVDVNEAACRSLGYTREELLTMSVSDVDVRYDAAKSLQHFAELRKHGTLRFESEQRTREGRMIPVEIVSNYLKFGSEERNCVFVRNITERKQAEIEQTRLQAQLQQAQKMESLGSLAGGIAHDMNNVLGAILGMASANIGGQPAGSPTYRAFDTIIQAAARGGKMVKSLLSFARQSPEEEHELDMNVILREEVNLLERTTLAKVRLELDLAGALRPVRGDANALTHAIMNLCVNAVDAMPENGTLTLRTRNVDDEWIEVMVEDTGVGMSKEVLEKALDPFFTTKEIGKGTGLGLSMVYSTVMAHKGQMEIQSEPDKGTRVVMRFPACEALAQVAVPAAEPRGEAATGTLSVLLVDDDELIQSSMQAILGVLGHHVTAVFSGEEALAKLAAGLRPDVVILDMNMPGLGGAGTLPRLRALNPTVPVLLATGRVDQFATAMEAGYPFVTLLSKPFSMRDLQQYLKPASRA